MSKFPTISPSDIDNFEGCPKRWHLKRIEKDPRFKFVVTEAITYGNLVHEQLEKYVKTGAVLPEHLEFVKPILDGLVAGGFTLYAELQCAVATDWSARGFWDKDAWLRGKVDLIALKDDFAMVIDYKTGKRKPDPTQLKIYGAMLKAVLKLKRVESCYLWLKTREGDAFELTDTNFEVVRAEITERIDAIRKAYDNNDFPARTSPLCGWCPALDTCKEAVYYKIQRGKKAGN